VPEKNPPSKKQVTDVSNNPVKSTPTDKNVTVPERLQAITGVIRVFHLDQKGNFIGNKENEHFRSKYSEIFKNLRDVLDIFALLPGSDLREKGVYEVEVNRLYYISTGCDCYFVSVDPAGLKTSIIQTLKKAVAGDDKFFF
jgi:hypothetical protein